ncbi:oxygenase MpaB family protein [Sphingomicrobium marinum]|uniref:oxygenase MpaB family protein n=1 Tax=Sphingomicrobium marinum TaxID=1227950 RepID=UPI00224008A2|nr:oxygenase MpaB family protein [Sphingomicrobium marinum]
MSPFEPLRERLVTHVRGIFNDPAKGEAPTPPSDDAWFEKDSPIRLVHADVVGMLVGGVRSLLLQMLHPHALQGVLDFSDFRADMHGRLKRTARFIAVTTFAHRDEAQAAIDRINRIHAEVSGTLPDGTPYDARDPRTLAWVHVVGAQSFLAGYMRYVDPQMSRVARDKYFDQFALVAEKLGADPVPRTQAQATAIFDDLKRDLRPSPKAREVARLVLSQRPEGTPRALQQMIAAEAVTMLPDFARRMLYLDKPRLGAMPARIGTLATARTLRWAFRQGQAPKA